MSARRITALDVGCPSCGAAPGVRCRVLTDASKSIPPHGLRREAAQREDRLLNPEHVDGQLPLFPRTQAGPVVFVCRRRR